MIMMDKLLTKEETIERLKKIDALFFDMRGLSIISTDKYDEYHQTITNSICMINGHVPHNKFIKDEEN